VILAHLLRRSCWSWNGSTRWRNGGKIGHCEWPDAGLGRTCVSGHLCRLTSWWCVAWRWHMATREGSDAGLRPVMGHLTCQVTFGRLWTISGTDRMRRRLVAMSSCVFGCWLGGSWVRATWRWEATSGRGSGASNHRLVTRTGEVAVGIGRSAFEASDTWTTRSDQTLLCYVWSCGPMRSIIPKNA
jgi:hypothetical protein